MEVREETLADARAIRAVHDGAFESPLEAILVDLLRVRHKLLGSMVVEDEGRVVGHIAFSQMVCPAVDEARLACLAPLGVDPAYQRRGVGSLLIQRGMAEMRELGFHAVFVLGEPTYYLKFGFKPAEPFGITNRFGGGEAWMVFAWDESVLEAMSGEVEYEPEFVIFDGAPAEEAKPPRPESPKDLM